MILFQRIVMLYSWLFRDIIFKRRFLKYTDLNFDIVTQAASNVLPSDAMRLRSEFQWLFCYWFGMFRRWSDDVVYRISWFREITHISQSHHNDDVIKWKRFPWCWPFVRRIHRWTHPREASGAELWCVLWSVTEQTVEQIVDTPVILVAITLIMMSP